MRPDHVIATGRAGLVVCVICCMLATGTAVFAQPGATRGGDPAPDTRLRVTLAVDGRTITGRLLSIDASSIVLAGPGGRPTRIERAAVGQWERSAGRRSRWRFTGIGFALGFGSGALAGLSTDGCRRGSFGPCITPAEGAAILGVFFGGIGAGVGALIPPSERWVAMPLPAPATASRDDR